MLSLSDISLLKSELQATFNVELHYHDVCPKPYFTLDRTNEEIMQLITDFIALKHQKPQFTADGLQFTVERG